MDVRVERLEPPPLIDADDAVLYAMTITTELDAQQLVTQLDMLFMRHGRVLSQLEFESTDAPFAVDLRSILAQLADSKIGLVADR